ncbi:MAG: DUF308 domain-containing protein [Lachnospiraceae bacterium]|nr:DUF308 domain-containing protein [Lachnospiraceae bacterium]
MKHFLRKNKYDWFSVACILLGIVLILYPQPFVTWLHWLLGVGFFVYSIVQLLRAVIWRKPGISIGDCLIKAILSIVIILQSDESIAIIGVIWAMQSLDEAAQEIDDFIRTRHFSPLNLISLVVSVVLSILLMIDPFEHIRLHIRFVGVEIITTLILARNNPEPV